MAKVKAYIKVAEYQGKPYVMTASMKPNGVPMKRGDQNLPTAMFAVEFDIPDSRFRLAEQVLAEIKVAESDITVAADIIYREE